MDALLIQIIGGLLMLLALSWTLLKFRKRDINLATFILWSLIWIIGLIFIFFPKAFESVTLFLGVGRPLDLILILGLIGVYYLLFQLYIRYNEIEKNITTLTQELAIKKEDEED